MEITLKYKRKDRNTDDITDAVLEFGFRWIDLHNSGEGFPDGVAVKWVRGLWCCVPMEIKGKYGKLTEAQESFDEKFPGLNHVVRTKEDVKKVLAIYEQRFNKK